MQVLESHVQHANACPVLVHPIAQTFGDKLLRIPAAGGQERIKRSDIHHGTERSLRCSPNHGFCVHLAEQVVVRLPDVVEHDGSHFDHVLIAGQHQGFLVSPLDPPVAMLQVPLVGRRLAVRRRF